MLKLLGLRKRNNERKQSNNVTSFSDTDALKRREKQELQIEKRTLIRTGRKRHLSSENNRKMERLGSVIDAERK